MDREKRIQEEVLRTLEMLERGQRITPNPLFYTRIQARLGEQEHTEGRLLLSGVLKPALLVLLVACNIATATVLLKRGAAEGWDRDYVVNAVGEELGLAGYSTDPFLAE